MYIIKQNGIINGKNEAMLEKNKEDLIDSTVKLIDKHRVDMFMSAMLVVASEGVI